MVMNRARKSAVRESSPHGSDYVAGRGGEHGSDPQPEGEAPVQMSEQTEGQTWKELQGEIPGLSPERVAEIRQRMRSDLYNSRAVAEIVARRVLAEGDL